MLINFWDYIDRCQRNGIRMNQAAMSRISGINRYTINMIYNDTGIYNAPPDKVYKMYLANPCAIDLPNDFYKYSIYSFILSKSMSKNTFVEIANKTKIARTNIFFNASKYKEYFMYDKKDMFNKAFDKIYTPCIIKNEELVDDKSLHENGSLVLTQGQKVPTIYCNSDNIKANMAIYGITKVDLCKLFPHFSKDIIVKAVDTNDVPAISRIIAGIFSTFFVPKLCI